MQKKDEEVNQRYNALNNIIIMQTQKSQKESQIQQIRPTQEQPSYIEPQLQPQCECLENFEIRQEQPSYPSQMNDKSDIITHLKTQPSPEEQPSYPSQMNYDTSDIITQDKKQKHDEFKREFDRAFLKIKQKLEEDMLAYTKDQQYNESNVTEEKVLMSYHPIFKDF